MIDRDLFVKYMAHVIAREGVSLMQYAPDISGGPGFTPEERQELDGIEREARIYLEGADCAESRRGEWND